MKTDEHCNHIAAIFAMVVLTFASYLAAARNPDAHPESVYAALAKAPLKAVTRRNPLENDPEAVVAGGKLFEIHCSECHGDMAEGGRKAPSLVADEVQRATPGTLFWVLTNGVVRRGMPVWSKLPEPQRWQIVRYLSHWLRKKWPNKPETQLDTLSGVRLAGICAFSIVISPVLMLR